MNNLKCPFCQQELVRHWGMKEPTLYCCDNPKCSRGGVATESAWQELIRTRKALEIAVDALKLMYQGNGDPQDIMRYIDNRWTPVRRLCKQTLEQITALEQKDVK